MSDNYFIVHDWMIEELNLKGNDLILFAIIYSFSKSGSFCFNGGREYLAKKSGISIRNIQYMLNDFVKKQIIDKTIIEKKKVKFCEYKMANPCKYCTHANIAPVQKDENGMCKDCILEGAKIAHNNILININNNKKENKKEKMKIANYNELKSAIREEYLYKVASIHKINKNTALSLLEAFVNINKDKKGNEFQFCQHFENWLNTDKGQQAINSTRLTTIITNDYNQD